MSQLAAARGQPQKPRRSTSIKVNIPRPLKLTRKDSVFPRHSSRVSLHLGHTRFKGSQNLSLDDWTRLRCSPASANILRVEPYLADEYGNSIMSYIAEHQTPSRSSRSRSSRHQKSRMASPHTPIKKQGRRDDSQSPAVVSDSKRVSGSGMTPDVPPPPPKDTPRPKKISSLDKNLPAKPALRYAEPPHQRGILDAADSAAKRMTVSYPPLRPSNVVNHRPSMSDSSFKITPSLKSVRGSVGFEVGTASRKNAQKVQGLPVTIVSQRSLRQTAIPFSLASRATASSSRAVSLSHGHIGAYKNGSPMERTLSARRKPVARTPVKFNRRNTRDFQVLQDNSSEEVIAAMVDIKPIEEVREVKKENFDVSGATLTEDAVVKSPVKSPVQSDVDRRFVNLGVGPTVRYANDAREVLMGKSPNVKPLKKSFGTSGTLLNDSPYPRIPPKSVNEVKSRFQAGEASASRLARPTASSAARTQESKAKLEMRKHIVQSEMKKAPEVKKGGKGIRGRVSDLLHGRRRSAQPINNNPPVLVHKNKTYDVRNMTAVEVILTGAQVDKVASDSDQQQTQTDRKEAIQSNTSTNNARRPARISPLANTRSPNDDGDRPPPPPANNVDALRTHYLENAAALQTDEARLEAAIAGVQASLDEIIATTQGIEYPGFRGVVEPVICSLAASIMSAQNARAAVIGLGNASQRVMTDTLLMSEAINRAATHAQSMVGDIQTMIPAAGAGQAA